MCCVLYNFKIFFPYERIDLKARKSQKTSGYLSDHDNTYDRYQQDKLCAPNFRTKINMKNIPKLLARKN